MTHPRQTIREAVQKILLNETEAGGNVYMNKMIPPQHENLPEIIIYTKDETITMQTNAPREYKRELDLVIEIMVQANNEVTAQDLLDKIARQVELLMGKDDSLLCNTGEAILTNIHLEYDESGTSPIGACVMNYNCIYYDTVPARS